MTKRANGTIGKAGYNPDEPRDDQGRWTTGGFDEGDNTLPEQPTAIDRARHEVCVERCHQILERPKRLFPGDLNEFAFRKCYYACMSSQD